MEPCVTNAYLFQQRSSESVFLLQTKSIETQADDKRRRDSDNISKHRSNVKHGICVMKETGQFLIGMCFITSLILFSKNKSSNGMWMDL